MDKKVIIISPNDNVAVAICEIKAGDKVSGVLGTDIKARALIPRNHKLAIAKIAQDGEVIKYGEPIGLAIQKIEPGDWVHTHNLKSEES